MEIIKESFRKSKILDLVVNGAKNLCIEELAKRINVSKRTIYREISEINDSLSCYGLEISNKQDKGLTMIGDLSAINELSNLLEQSPDRKQYSDVNFRRRKLIADSLKNREIEKLSYYSSIFKVSESTISHDLNYIEKWLKKYHLSLTREQGKGVGVVGKEEDIRIALKEFLSGDLVQGNHKPLFQLSDDSCEPIETQMFQQLNINPDYIFITLKEYETELDGLFADESFNALAIHIAISIRRIMDGNHVPHSITSNISEYQDEYTLAKKLSEKISLYYKVNFSDSEIYFLFLHIISTKMVKDSSLIFKLGEVKEENTIKRIAEEIIRLVNNAKQITINNEKYLDNLQIHLRPMINRIEYGLKLENPLLETIKKEYPEAYGIAWMANSIFKRYIGKDISEDEAAFIAIHIQSMIEGTKEYLKVVIVCSSGIGISQLIATRIKQRYAQLEVVSIESVASFNHKHYCDEIDLVLSTFPIQTDVPIILVDPLVKEEDIKKIDDFIYNHSNDEKNIFENIVLETFIHPAWRKQNQIIKNVSRRLVKKGLVYDTFFASIQNREKINSTSIGMKVALPHATFDSVIKSTLVIVTLEQPILWGDDEVDLVVFIALTKKDSIWATNVLKNIYYKLYFLSSHNLLLKAQSYDEILKILTE